MTSYLLDTHIWAWDLKLDQQLPKRVVGIIDRADSIYVSVISFYEIAQKVRIGKWPDMASLAADLQTPLAEQGYQILNLTAEISQLAGLMDWDHRDPFDRIIAATAIHLKLPLVSADKPFDALSGRKDWPGCVW